MTENPDEINDADRFTQSKLYEIGQSYAARNERSKKENKGRAEERDRIDKLGIDTGAFQVGVRLIKTKSERERREFMRDLNLTLKVLGSRQQELFPEEALRIAKREDDRKRKEEEAAAEARKQPELDAATDKNPRSDPKAGGAGKKPRKGKTDRTTTDPKPEEVAAGISAEPGPMAGTLEEQEAAAGDAVLKSMAPETQKSQSAIAAERIEAAMHPGETT